MNTKQNTNKVLNYIARDRGGLTGSIQRVDVHVVVFRHEEFALFLLLRLGFGLLLLGILPIHCRRAFLGPFFDLWLFGLGFGLSCLSTRSGCLSVKKVKEAYFFHLST